MVDVDPARDLPDRSSIAAKLVCMNDLWDVILTYATRQEGLRSFGGSGPPMKIRQVHQQRARREGRPDQGEVRPTPG